MKRVLIILMGLALLLSLGSAKPISIKQEPYIIIIDKVEIEILGISTMGKYNCSNIFATRDTITINSENKNNLKAEITMNNFECGNKFMNEDLKATIMAKKFPKSYVFISNIKPYSTNYKCDLTFLITDKNMKYKDLIIKDSKENLEGSIALKFSDLALSPPSKMAGIIKVKDDIVVHFILHKKR